ncbi:vegetative incompatibility protein HET-E-1 [Xylaria intraflava]|nr:vegetative incompatibility protein HET-E-1 [Xylaria intraflava]
MADALSVAANVVAVIELSAKVIAQCLQYSRGVQHAKEDIERVNKEVTSWETVTNELRTLLDGPHGTKLRASQKLRDALENGRALLQNLHDKLTPRRRHKILDGLRSLKWPFDSKEINQIILDLNSYIRPITTTLQVDQTNTMLELDQKWVLDKLPLAEGAAFDSYAEQDNPTCLLNTRAGLLRDISVWVKDSEKPVFWLNGMAGTGKSTISRTLAHSFFDHGQLGASFFFKRGEGDRGGASKFFTTIAFQLVQQEPALAPHVKAAIDADPAIIGKRLDDQFEKLILEPLSKCSSGGRVLVVDALDECDRDQDIRRIIHLLSRINVSKPPQLRVFLTSRPELPIRLGFHAVKSTYESLILHNIEHSIVERDLSVFFTHELEQIRMNYNSDYNSDPDQQLPPTWPEQSEIQTLVDMAVPLFIFAATVCRFLADFKNGNPETKLRKILKYETESHKSQLNAMYLPVLEQQLSGLPKKDRAVALECFRRVIGSIILLASPLSTSALARLLNTTTSEINDQLISLHSVLSIPPSSSAPVRLLHLSFRDFLVDASNDENLFWVDEKEGHKQLAIRCIQIMSKTLLKNICEVNRPGKSQASIDPEIISKKLAPEVQYACQYWIFHIQQAGHRLRLLDDDLVHRFLQQHFLHWLEALSLIGRAWESPQNIRILQSLCESEDCIKLSQFVGDALRFVLTNISTIQAAPLQIYCSALVFAPENSIIRRTFESDIPDWIYLRPKVDAYWDSCLQTIEDHGLIVTSVAFSPDGTAVASTADHRIRFWSTNTGEHLQTLKSHPHGTTTSIAFSPDGRTLASGSTDHKLRLWSVDTGAHLQTFSRSSTVNPDDAVVSVAFSPDGQIVVSGLYDGTVNLWSVTMGKALQTLECHTRGGLTIMFSLDGEVIASGSGKTVQLWSVSTGENVQTLKGHTDAVTSAVFSPDSKIVVSGSMDKTIRFSSAETGETLQILKGHTGGIRSIVLSPDGRLVVSGSEDNTVRLWSADTGQNLQILNGHTGIVTSVAMSPNGKTIASGSYDRTVRLWSVDMNESLPKLKSYAPIVSVSSSLDGKIVASGSIDGTIQLWSSDTGENLHILNGHTGRVSSVVFSPDGKIVASRSPDDTVRLWSISTGENLRILHVDVLTVTFSPDSKILALGEGSKAIQLWSIETGENVHTLKGRFDVDSVTFSPDGRFVASTTWEKTIELWSADTGEKLHTFEGHTNHAISVAISPDSSIVVSGARDRRLGLWSVSTGAIIRFVYIGFAPESLSFDAGGESLLTEAGAISMSDLYSPTLIGTLSESGSSSIEVVPHHHPECFLGYGLNRGRSWITFNGRKLLRLPMDCRLHPDDRVTTTVVRGATIMMGTITGKVIVMRFPDGGP